MRASRVEDDPSVLYIRLVDSRIRSQQTAFHSEDESRDAPDYLVRLSKNEFAQLGRETILRSNLLRLGLGRTEERETTLPSEIATNLLDTTRTSPSLRSSPTILSVRAGKSNSESILGVLTGAREIKRGRNVLRLNKECSSYRRLA